MSRCFDIACTQCKKALWIGQSHKGKATGYIYLSDSAVMHKLNNFLWEHRGHSLVFDYDETFINEHYKED